MRLSRFLSLALLFISIGLFSSCQEEEVARPTFGPVGGGPVGPIDWEPLLPPPAKEDYVAESTLYSDEATTKILGQSAQLFFRLPRPKGCPVRLGPLCDPGFEFRLTGYEGVDLEDFVTEKGFEGSIVDPKTGRVVAELTGISGLPVNSGAFTLFYTAVEEPKILSGTLRVTFRSLYNTDSSLQPVGFQGKVTSEIFGYLP